MLANQGKIRKSVTYLIFFAIQLTSILSVPQCFNESQLPIEIKMTNDQQWFSQIAYHPNNNYLAIGGVYGEDLMIGLFNNKEKMKRLMWLNSFNFDCASSTECLKFFDIESIEFQQDSSIISLIRSKAYNQILDFDQVDLTLVKFDLAAFNPLNSNGYIWGHNLNKQVGAYNILFAQFSLDNNIPINYMIQSTTTNQLATYDVIIPLIEMDGSVVAGCLEFGFMCMGMALFSQGNMQVFYRSINSQSNDIFYTARINKDPFKVTFDGKLVERNFRIQGNEPVIINSFRFFNKIGDYVHLGQSRTIQIQGIKIIPIS
ncbi:UNKNOWN [Stylonychia lemnae]|uniref:Uncharacterized protein n=1 Tax=Stylonychia lemnae TaxID=5949 RepID=A0A078B3E1_STYLE|nr:UNKNOWN [Stylonychia lemnae]|eukprot:CDW89045.1 UNKNOWN [Stylonychia lemnae]